MIRTRPARALARRPFAATAAGVAVASLVTGFILVGPPAHAAQADGPSAVVPAAASSGPLTTLASSAAARASASAVELAVAATPAPPPPVYCPAPGSQFVDSWGFARSGGRRHKGVDMMAPYGTPVIAPVAGVVRASHSALGGLGFYLDDVAGNEYFGSHLASLDVVGPVEAGTQIGTVGSSGNAGSPHLHFEGRAGRWRRGGPLPVRPRVVHTGPRRSLGCGSPPVS